MVIQTEFNTAGEITNLDNVQLIKVETAIVQASATNDHA